ncbi:hypothetical protein EZV62_019043 [Acer yangbiense]|uniref:SWIM-type domain-containing protein n=1 Tax=Acer yangbiense TaxID=1000413 RepID=A0A5C7HA56_9ROSI|nr:hypothetical protein EZV62_019043 [Acer yangbiense]
MRLRWRSFSISNGNCTPSPQASLHLSETEMKLLVRRWNVVQEVEHQERTDDSGGFADDGVLLFTLPFFCCRNFMFNGTATFSGKHFVLGCFERDYICLKDLWDSAMHEVLGLEAVVGDKFRQEVQFPWNAEVREIENDAGLMDVLTEFERRKVNQIHFNVEYQHFTGPRRSEDHKNSYNKLYRYGHIIMERNPGSYVKMKVISDLNPQIPATFQRFKLDYLKDIFWPAATSSNKVAFLKAMDEIKQTSPEAHAYLSNISVETWAVHAFDSVCKSEHNTNNVVEAFNGWMNKHRALPMLTMMERVRRKFMKRIQDRYEAAILWESNIPPVINRKLQKAQQKGRYLDPLRCGEDEFEVVDGNRRFVVELDKRTCQCGIWVISGVPCMHAMACITKKRDNVEDYVHDYLKKPTYLRTYSNNFHAIPDENLWPNGNFKTVLPPIKKRGVGRPKLSRKRGSTEPNKVQRSVGFRCSICKEVGHNSRTCKNKSNPEAASTSTAPPRPQKATKRMTNEATNSSTHGSTHPTHSSTQTGNATATSAAGNGTATTAASPRISGTVTRVLWFPSRPEGILTQTDATNDVSTQPLTQGAPQPSQQSQP